MTSSGEPAKYLVGEAVYIRSGCYTGQCGTVVEQSSNRDLTTVRLVTGKCVSQYTYRLEKLTNGFTE